MALLASLSNRQFVPQVRDIAFTVDVNATEITVTFERGDWPEGPCIRAELLWGGISSGVFETGGGLVRDKAGTPTGGSMLTTWTASKPPGVTTGTARVEVLQTVRSAVRVESN